MWKEASYSQHLGKSEKGRNFQKKGSPDERQWLPPEHATWWKKWMEVIRCCRTLRASTTVKKALRTPGTRIFPPQVKTKHQKRKPSCLPLPASQSLSSSLYGRNLTRSHWQRRDEGGRAQFWHHEAAKRMCVEIKGNKFRSTVTQFIIVVKEN